MTVYFHIGLPKTATTFWQRSVFTLITDMNVIHRSNSLEAESFLSDLRKYVHAPPVVRTQPAREALTGFMRSRAADRDLLISNENISLTSRGFWRGSRSSPERVANALCDLARDLGPAPIGIIVGMRRPDSWLAARYAESSKAFAEFGQADFENRVSQLIDKEQLEGAEQWLDRPRVVTVFRDRFGAENTHFPTMEDLEEAPEAAIIQMGRFLGARDFTDIAANLKSQSQLTKRRNSLSNDDGTWRLRSNGTCLHFPQNLRSAFLSRFGAGTEAPAGG